MIIAPVCASVCIKSIYMKFHLRRNHKMICIFNSFVLLGSVFQFLFNALLYSDPFNMVLVCLIIDSAYGL